MISIKGHRVLVKVLKMTDADEVYARAARAGIQIAEDHEEHRRAQAFHYNSNPNGEEFVPWARVGDFIAFAKYSGKMLEDPEDGQKYIVINDEDVVAVLREATNG
jgi:co-chaperonin GroES (HSP10)